MRQHSAVTAGALDVTRFVAASCASVLTMGSGGGLCRASVRRRGSLQCQERATNATCCGDGSTPQSSS
eukprot:6230605-Prymnesium_polylepis.1